MKHALTEQLAAMRLRRRHIDALLYVAGVAGALTAALTLLVFAVLKAPTGWSPL